MKQEKDNLMTLVLLLVLLVVVGTVGYKQFMDISYIDALYMTVITISTVGYGEIGVMDMEAKLFSIVLIFVSLGTVGYLFSTMISLLIEGDIVKTWKRRKMINKIRNMNNHYIICGGGETAYNSIKQFKKSKVDFVVIDHDEDKIAELVSEEIPAVLGDASNEDILKKVNIHKAKGLISALPTDAENIYTVLTARQMNPELYIVSRAINSYAADKLKRAGANNTISPNEIGGSRMASLMLRPTVMSFLDVITHAGDVILDLEEVTIFAKSNLINKTLRESRIPEKTGLIVLAIRKHDQTRLSFNPSSDEKLEEGDVMVVLGDKERTNTLRQIANDRRFD